NNVARILSPRFLNRNRG
ncbi:hypothetical protein D030_3401B, partial [Vibrio parahaemolyticus AQ3810]